MEQGAGGLGSWSRRPAVMEQEDGGPGAGGWGSWSRRPGGGGSWSRRLGVLEQEAGGPGAGGWGSWSRRLGSWSRRLGVLEQEAGGPGAGGRGHLSPDLCPGAGARLPPGAGGWNLAQEEDRFWACLATFLPESVLIRSPRFPHRSRPLPHEIRPTPGDPNCGTGSCLPVQV